MSLTRSAVLTATMALIALGSAFTQPARAAAARRTGTMRATDDSLRVVLGIQCNKDGTYCQRTVQGVAGAPHQKIYLDRAQSANPKPGDWEGWIATESNLSWTGIVFDGPWSYSWWRVCVYDGSYRWSPWRYAG